MTENEKEQIKSYDSLLAYCELALGTGKRSGSEHSYRFAKAVREDDDDSADDSGDDYNGDIDIDDDDF